MTYDEWKRLMELAGWEPLPDIFGNIVQWQRRRGERVITLSRQLAEHWRAVGMTPPPF